MQTIWGGQTWCYLQQKQLQNLRFRTTLTFLETGKVRLVLEAWQTKTLKRSSLVKDLQTIWLTMSPVRLTWSEESNKAPPCHQVTLGKGLPAIQTKQIWYCKDRSEKVARKQISSASRIVESSNGKNPLYLSFFFPYFLIALRKLLLALLYV